MNAILSLMLSDGANGSGLVLSRWADSSESIFSVEPNVGAAVEGGWREGVDGVVDALNEAEADVVGVARDEVAALDGSVDGDDAAGVAFVADAYVGIAAVEDGGGDGLTLNRPGGGNGGEEERLSPTGAIGAAITP